jgi:hypothetical protein
MSITAAELLAEVRGDTDQLPADMARAEAIVSRASKGIADAGSAAGHGFGGQFGSAVQQVMPRELGHVIHQLAGPAAAAGVVALGAYLGHAAMEAGRFGAEVRGVQRGFAIMIPEGEQGLERLRAATRGTMTDMALMESASTARIMGVVQGIDQLVEIKEVATARAGAMGRSVEQYFQGMVTAIGTGNQQALRNLGIMLDLGAVYDTHAKSIGVATSELTEQQKVQARLNAILQDETTQAMTAVQKEQGGTLDLYDRLDVSVANFKATLALATDEVVRHSGALGVMADAIEAVDRRVKAEAEFKRAARETNKVIQELTGLREEERQALIDAWEEHVRWVELFPRSTEAIEESERSLRLRTLAIIEGSEATGYGIHMTESQARALLGLAPAQQQNVGLLYAQESAAYAAAAAQDRLTRSISGSAGVLQQLREVDMPGITPADFRAREDARFGLSIVGMTPAQEAAARRARIERGWFAGREVDLLREQSRIKQLELQTERKITREIGSQNTAREKTVDQARDLRRLVEGVLRPTAVTPAHMAQTALGTYLDQWDEHMRRLRATDIAPHDLAEAEHLFYSGQMLDQINWEAVIRDVQRQIEAEAGREQLIQEAMRHVGAAGLGASQFQVAVALGVADYTEVGARQGSQIATGLEQAGVAAKFTETFEQEFQQQEERWVLMGELSVEWFGQGIRQGVTPDFVELLVRVLAPRLEGALAHGRRP